MGDSSLDDSLNSNQDDEVKDKKRKISPSVQKDNEIINETLKGYKNDYYDFNAFPVTYSHDKKTGFKIFGDRKEFVYVLRKVDKMFNVKNEVFSVKGIRLKTTTARGQSPNILMSVFMDNTGTEEGTMQMKFSKNKNLVHTLSIERAKGAEFVHAQWMFQAVTHLIDVFLMPNKQFTEKDFIITEKKESTVCDKCGLDWRTPRGLKLHQPGCGNNSKRDLDTSVSSDNNDDVNNKKARTPQVTFHPDVSNLNQDSQSQMDVDTQKQSNDDNVFAVPTVPVTPAPPPPLTPTPPPAPAPAPSPAPAAAAAAPPPAPSPAPAPLPASSPAPPPPLPITALTALTALSVLPPTIPKDLSPAMKVKLEDFSEKYFPGYMIRDVKADGSCLPRTLSRIFFNQEELWWLFAQALNKLTMRKQNWDILKNTIDFSQPIVVGAGERKYFRSEKDLFPFLLSEKSLLMWRCHQDISLISSFVKRDIILIEVRDGIVVKAPDVIGVNPRLYSSPADLHLNDDNLVIIWENGNHYKALVNPNGPVGGHEELQVQLTTLASDDHVATEVRVANVEKLLTEHLADCQQSRLACDTQLREQKALVDSQGVKISQQQL